MGFRFVAPCALARHFFGTNRVARATIKSMMVAVSDDQQALALDETNERGAIMARSQRPRDQVAEEAYAKLRQLVLSTDRITKPVEQCHACFSCRQGDDAIVVSGMGPVNELPAFPRRTDKPAAMHAEAKGATRRPTCA